MFDHGSFIRSAHLDLRKLTPDLLVKASDAELFIERIIHQETRSVHDTHVHFVEDRLSNFSGGRTMLQVLMKLAAFNAIVSYLLLRTSQKIVGFNNTRVEHIHPSTVKATMRREGLLIPKGADKKELTLDFFRNSESYQIDLNRNGKPQPWSYDEADAYIVARAGILRDKCNLTESSRSSDESSETPVKRGKRRSSTVRSTRRGRDVPKDS